MANYGLVWASYLAAAAVFVSIVWHLFVFRRFLLLTYVVRGLALALLLTPWTSNIREPYLAPALMILALDGITLGPEAAVRAFVPLFVGTLLGVIVACALWLRQRKKRQRDGLL